MKDAKFIIFILLVCGAAIALHFFAVDINVSGQKGYYVLFKNSGICTISQSWAGLNENLHTWEVLDRIAAAAALQSIDSSGFQEWSAPFGAIWFPQSASPWTIHFALEQFEIGAYPGIQVHPGDIVMDCGGYVGDWTKWVLQASAAKVIIIEPAHDALECICSNLKADINQSRVVLYPKGVWDREGMLYLSHVPNNPAANTLLGADTSTGELIHVTTIDQIVSELKLNRLDIIKMDIEGAEVRAIYGARNTLNRFRPCLAIATEHTSNIAKNNRDVIEAIREIAPFYQMKCGICSFHDGLVVPVTLYFSP